MGRVPWNLLLNSIKAQGPTMHLFILRVIETFVNEFIQPASLAVFIMTCAVGLRLHENAQGLGKIYKRNRII